MVTQRNSRGDSVALNEAIQAVQSAADLIGSLMGDIKENAMVSASLKTEVRVLKEEINKISNVLTDGYSGVRPFQTRIAVLEGDSETIKNRLEVIKIEFEAKTEKIVLQVCSEAEKRGASFYKKFEDLERKLRGVEKGLSLLKLDRDLKLASIKGRWQLYVALITGTLAFFGVLLTLLDKYYG